LTLLKSLFYCPVRPRSGRKHTAWGEAQRNPRTTNTKIFAKPAQQATALRLLVGQATPDNITCFRISKICRPRRGLPYVWTSCPGAYAPGFMLSPAPQASGITSSQVGSGP
jgi:hypothetical protein